MERCVLAPAPALAARQPFAIRSLAWLTWLYVSRAEGPGTIPSFLIPASCWISIWNWSNIHGDVSIIAAAAYGARRGATLGVRIVHVRTVLSHYGPGHPARVGEGREGQVKAAPRGC